MLQGFCFCRLRILRKLANGVFSMGTFQKGNSLKYIELICPSNIQRIQRRRTNLHLGVWKETEKWSDARADGEAVMLWVQYDKPSFRQWAQTLYTCCYSYFYSYCDPLYLSFSIRNLCSGQDKTRKQRVVALLTELIGIVFIRKHWWRMSDHEKSHISHPELVRGSSMKLLAAWLCWWTGVCQRSLRSPFLTPPARNTQEQLTC